MNNTVKGKRLAIPYLIFLVLFVLLPLFVIVYYGFTDDAGNIAIDNILDFFTSKKTLGTLFYSFVIAVLTTVICLVIAYPTAYILSKAKLGRKTSMIMLFVLPMWINFTLRITALKEILTIIEGNLAYYSFINTIICMVYDFLPFMILPIYNTLTKLDKSYEEAALDLGATPLTVIFKVIVPLSLPGIVSGVTMVFLPSMTNYVVLDMVYNSTYIMGSLIGSYFSAYDWHNGSVISLVLLLFICMITYISDKFTEKDNGAGRGFGELRKGKA